MAFHFPLQTLLRLREIAEQREERLLGQIMNQIVVSRETLTDLAVQRRGLLIQREEALLSPVSAAEISGYYGRLRRIDELEQTGVEQLAKLDSLREQQAKVYEAAHHQTELLSFMRAEQKEMHIRELDRKDQKTMDDNFLSRRIHQ